MKYNVHYILHCKSYINQQLLAKYLTHCKKYFVHDEFQVPDAFKEERLYSYQKLYKNFFRIIKTYQFKKC